MNTLLILTLVAMATLFAGLFSAKKIVLPLAIIGLIGAIWVTVNDWGIGKPIFNDMLNFDNYAVAFSGLLLVMCLLNFIITSQHFKEEDKQPELYTLMLLVVAGGVVMTCFSDLTMLFIGIEILSISLYILAGSRKLDTYSNEAAIKYFLLGSFSTAILLFGIALIYGSVGDLHLISIQRYVNSAEEISPLFKGGILLMLAGLAFKIGVAPFHFWAPDVYEGSPTHITMFMATVVKIAAFAALFRLFITCFTGVSDVWQNIVLVIAVLTMTIANITALTQKSVKRMLAWSSVSNAGYLLIVLLNVDHSSLNALYYYLTAYSLATIIAFACVMAVEKVYENVDGFAFRGFIKRYPLMGFALTIAMLSLAGIPPLAGFFAKFYIFSHVLSSGWVWLIIIAVINSIIGISYYFGLLLNAFVQSEEMKEIPLPLWYSILLFIAALGLIVLGVLPSMVYGLI